MKSRKKVEAFLLYLEKQLDEKNLSVPQFAKMLGVPRVTVYTWLNRKSVMSLEKYYRALEVLGIDEKLFIKPTTNEDSISGEL